MTFNYIEYPLTVFLKLFPDYAPLFMGIDVSDPRYLVRVRGDEMEVGYSTDKWQIH